MKECCQEVLWESVVEKCCEEVLWRSFVVKCCIAEKCCEGMS